MDFITSIKTCLFKYVDFTGRASRAEFWYFTLFTMLLSVIAEILDAALAGQSVWSYSGFFGPMSSIVTVVTTLPCLAVAARRLHDVGKSGWWQLLYLTIIGTILLLIWYSSGTQKSENKFGVSTAENPEIEEKDTLPVWIKFFIIPIIGVFVSCLILFVTLLEVGMIPDTEVMVGSELSSSTKTTLIDQRIISETDNIRYFYSTEMLSFSKEGQLVTDTSIISYSSNDEGIVQIWEMEFREIDRVELVQEGSFFQDSIYKIYGNAQAEYEWIEVWLSTENGGDKLFINEVEKNVR
ncbi:DUF805 domain-containing protein [Planktomarina temperata]|nr:DUF805 domain-containing protein [Planktomarina temperata]